MYIIQNKISFTLIIVSLFFILFFQNFIIKNINTPIYSTVDPSTLSCPLPRPSPHYCLTIGYTYKLTSTLVNLFPLKYISRLHALIYICYDSQSCGLGFCSKCPVGSVVCFPCIILLRCMCVPFVCYLGPQVVIGSRLLSSLSESCPLRLANHTVNCCTGDDRAKQNQQHIQNIPITIIKPTKEN